MSALNVSSVVLHLPSTNPHFHHNSPPLAWFRLRGNRSSRNVRAFSSTGSAASSASYEADLTSTGEVHGRKSRLESLFCYDVAIPEEGIEKPLGLALAGKCIGDSPQCAACEAKGVVLCRTCSGSGLYTDSILESQGIIVKVRCLGCGGTGNNMCAGCGGRGHL